MPEPPQATFAEIGAALRGAERVLVLGHVRPDGDAIGSQLALASCLEAAGIAAVPMNEDGCPENLGFLPGSEAVRRPGEDLSGFDLCVALDTANRDRLGASCLDAAEGLRMINIDHHISNERYGDLVHVDADAPATGEILFELIEALGLPLTEVARDALFVAISTDTGSFRYPATTSRTYEVGAALLAAGADCGALSSACYERFPFRRIELLRELLGTLRMDQGGRVASWSLDLGTKARLGTQPGDSEGLSDLIRAVDTVDVAVFFEELHGGTVRVSMRSKVRETADVSAICGAFGGGGHPLAAGARIAGPFAEVRESVLGEIGRRLGA